jgi:spore coat protein U-like protein
MRRAEPRLLAAAIGLALALLPAPALAACTVGTTGVAFGAYDSLSATPDDSTGTIEVDCHPSDQSVEVAIGTGLSGSFAPRRMGNGAATLNYNLYTSAARAIVWGDGTQGTASQTLTSGIVNSGTRHFTAVIHGRIPAAQSVPAGTYGDTLIVTINF